MRCDVCDFDYSEYWSASRRAHVIAHHEWDHGVPLRQSTVFELVGEVQGFHVLLVRPSSSRFVRRRAERVSRRSIREPVLEGGYDKPLYFAEGSDSPSELFAHAVLLERDNYGVGIVVVERRPIIQFYRWTSRPNFELVTELSDTIRWTVVHAWLLPQLRGRGLAAEAVRAVLRGFEETPDTVGWLSPYTPAGWRLIERLTNVGFHRACCELPSLEKVPPPFHREYTG